MTLRSPGLLGDTAARDYSRKLQLFNAFAEPELRQAIGSLGAIRGARVLDAGCGTGEAVQWLTEAVDPGGAAIGMDLAAAHVSAACERASGRIVQADVCRPPFVPRSFDLIWAVNALNHLRDPSAALRALASLMRAGGRIAVGQSSLLADMFFAWNSRLERVTTEAVRAYYRDRYGLTEHELSGVRSLVGLLRSAELQDVQARTFVLERVSPLAPADEAYLVESVFRGTWGERLRPYLSSEDYEELACLCEPHHPQFALRRPDFHFLQTFTLVVGTVR